MKLPIAAVTLSLAAAATTSAAAAIESNSDVGRSLLSNARRLDGNNNNNNGYDDTWMQNFSLKFQGCRTALSYNDNADENADVRVASSKLAHFRLCASDSCSSWNGGGCSTGYGDYVVSLADFAQAFVEGQRRSKEFACQTFKYEKCSCTDSDDKDDGFNREYCEYDCYSKNGKSECIDRNPYEEENGGQRQERFEAERYVGCQQLEINNNDDGNTVTYDYDEYGNVITYYIGTLCSDKGNAVHLAMFTDDTCTIQADDAAYYRMTGTSLPYSYSSKTSLITPDCVSCVEQEDPERQAEQQANGEQEELKISDACTKMYYYAGKCESGLKADSKYTEADTQACSYIAGIKISRSNGILDTNKIGRSKVATAFIVILSVAFAGLAAFAFTLHKKIKEAQKNTLLD